MPSPAGGQFGPHTEQEMLTLAPASNGLGAPGRDSAWTGESHVPFPGDPPELPAPLRTIAGLGPSHPAAIKPLDLPRLSVSRAHVPPCSSRHSTGTGVSPTCPGYPHRVSLVPSVLTPGQPHVLCGDTGALPVHLEGREEAASLCDLSVSSVSQSFQEWRQFGAPELLPSELGT